MIKNLITRSQEIKNIWKIFLLYVKNVDLLNLVYIDLN